MSAPERRRPGASSSIKLAANVESVHTGAAAEQAATPAPESPLAPEAPPRAEFVKEETKPTTVQMRTGLKKRAETAVLRTAGLPGGFKSFTALVDAAVERELARLADEFNDGAPFEQNRGEFRTGRPLGS
ncbi:hypothetical protein [Clavibacter nebraskensis]|uniref:hypothetical protein n=1 Tax=Clavibacter nebraskensis TaxID=31963 RepID=UPI00200E05F7|nr:hypothetical protein [Clavibacter nebraskensis]UQB17867.1 hypothetical protein LIX22_003006 [Clavibacter nebraskensis]